MRFGIALPHYDFSLPGQSLDWKNVRDWAMRAEDLGFDSIWVSDHLFLDISRYGGPEKPQATVECFTALGALAAATSRVRLGSLVVCNDLRSPALVAKMAASLDVLSGGRMEIGLGAGWFEAEYDAAGVPFEDAGVRVGRLEEAVQIVVGMLSSESFSFEGRHYRVKDAANRPRPVQRPRPPVFIGGKGDRIARLAGKYADGFNTVWSWTPDAYGDRVRLVNEATERAGRHPAAVKKTIGLYCLPGTSEHEVDTRWNLYKKAAPGVGPETLDEWKADKLWGDADRILSRLDEFAALGAEEVILGFGLLPFQIADAEAVEWFAKELIPHRRQLRG